MLIQIELILYFRIQVARGLQIILDLELEETTTLLKQALLGIHLISRHIKNLKKKNLIIPLILLTGTW